MSKARFSISLQCRILPNVTNRDLILLSLLQQLHSYWQYILFHLFSKVSCWCLRAENVNLFCWVVSIGYSLYLDIFELVQDLVLHLLIIIKGIYKNWDNFSILYESLPRKQIFCVMLCVEYDDKKVKFLNWKNHFSNIFVRVKNWNENRRWFEVLKKLSRNYCFLLNNQKI